MAPMEDATTAAAASPVEIETTQGVVAAVTDTDQQTQQHAVNGENDEDIKLIVLNYGKWKDAKAMDQVLRAHGVAFRKVQKSRQLSFGFVHFHTQEERDAVMPQLRAIEWNGEKMDVKTALPRKSNKPLKRSRDDGRGRKGASVRAEDGDAGENNDDDREAAGAADGDEGQEGETPLAKEAPKHAREVVTPWADVPYEEQLQRKEGEMKKVLVKIVRQTRKEYFKKEKRVNNELRHRKKQKTEARENEDGDDGDDDKRGTSTFIPTWLTSHGSLFVVAGDVLYSRPHEGGAAAEWSRVLDAPSLVAIVSFGSELVAATADSSILVLKQGPDAMYWDKLCDGPSEPILSLASLRGYLLCCTASGKIVKQEGTGRFATGTWTELAHVEGARSISMHNGFVYAFCGADAADAKKTKWQRAPLPLDPLDSLAFEPFDWPTVELPEDEVVGLCSHDHQLILLSGQSLFYGNPDGVAGVESTVPLSLPGQVTKITGLASHKGLCCPMDSIHASPSTVGYRNKCEFSIGFDADEKPCVGFRMGLFRDGSVVVSPPHDCVNVSPVMVKVCAAMQSLLETSDVPVYDVKTQTGVWRQLTVRYGERTQQLMVVLQINPKGLSAEERQNVHKLTADTFTGELDGARVTSLFVQEYEGVSTASEDEPLVHLFGEKTIEEHLLGKRFSISPSAFFQVNTQGAETLYSLVRQHANADESTLLYDVCCGTGTIGICASIGAAKVIGIEICKAATDDATVNAELNGVKNITFVNSKAEDVMKDLLKTKQEGTEDAHLKRVVAIVDPPRAGLHHQVLRSLRSCPPVDRIVYVSCNPTGSLIQDAITLCGPKTKSITGNAFRPVHAIPVDMFPHTPHCEMIIVFDRVAKASNV